MLLEKWASIGLNMNAVTQVKKEQKTKRKKSYKNLATN